jgi:hypothetical protein
MSSVDEKRWSAEKANLWYASKPWLVGCNFIPSNAINQLEMWQADTFDPKTIDRELSWAEGLGFNAVRVFLHDLLWLDNPQGFIERVRQYLEIAAGHGISTTFVFFDDCWCVDPALGKQPEPVPFVHNSGWAQSPGGTISSDPQHWKRLENYVKGVLTIFAHDERVLMWDLYNEPGNSGHRDGSMPLLQEVFRWAREIRPSQPLTAGVWFPGAEADAFNAFQLGASDVITFHNYLDAEKLSAQIQELRRYERPLICSEYMIRPTGSIFSTTLPVFEREKVGCLNWGLVKGKTQTHIPWKWDPADGEPKQWFADILKEDGIPFDPKEVETIRSFTEKIG